MFLSSFGCQMSKNPLHHVSNTFMQFFYESLRECIFLSLQITFIPWHWKVSRSLDSITEQLHIDLSPWLMYVQCFLFFFLLS